MLNSGRVAGSKNAIAGSRMIAILKLYDTHSIKCTTHIYAGKHDFINLACKVPVIYFDKTRVHLKSAEK